MPSRRIVTGAQMMSQQFVVLDIIHCTASKFLKVLLKSACNWLNASCICLFPETARSQSIKICSTVPSVQS